MGAVFPGPKALWYGTATCWVMDKGSTEKYGAKGWQLAPNCRTFPRCCVGCGVPHGEHFNHMQGNAGGCRGGNNLSAQLPAGRQWLQYTINLPVAISEQILLGGNRQGTGVYTHMQVSVCNGGSCCLTPTQAAHSPAYPSLMPHCTPAPNPPPTLFLHRQDAGSEPPPPPGADPGGCCRRGWQEQER